MANKSCANISPRQFAGDMLFGACTYADVNLSVNALHLSGVLFVLLLAVQRGQAAELTPINFVASDSAGIVEVIKFSEIQGLFKKQGLDKTMIYLPSGVMAAQTAVCSSVLLAHNSASDIVGKLAGSEGARAGGF